MPLCILIIGLRMDRTGIPYLLRRFWLWFRLLVPLLSTSFYLNQNKSLIYQMTYLKLFMRPCMHLFIIVPNPVNIFSLFVDWHRRRRFLSLLFYCLSTCPVFVCVYMSILSLPLLFSFHPKKFIRRIYHRRIFSIYLFDLLPYLSL